jgi:hypothetical protein
VIVAMQGMEGIFGDVGHFIVKAALLPITAPIALTKIVASEGVGAVKGALGDIKSTLAILKPPPPPPPPVADAFGVGGAGTSLASLGAVGTSSSKVPLIVGGVALVGLVLVAVLTLKGKKTKGRRR